MCYVRVTIPYGEGAILGENMCPTSLTPLSIENWSGPCSGVHTTVTGQLADTAASRCSFVDCGRDKN